MPQPATSAELMTALRSAAGRKMTRREITQQKVSFVISAVSDDTEITREEVEKVIKQQEGADS